MLSKTILTILLVVLAVAFVFGHWEDHNDHREEHAKELDSVSRLIEKYRVQLTESRNHIEKMYSEGQLHPAQHEHFKQIYDHYEKTYNDYEKNVHSSRHYHDHLEEFHPEINTQTQKQSTKQ
eukprot:c15884_g1_i1.p1 GENE.c15884_g1_i1~~c15884_g1_i1.p1  ORF type:complete len:122 (+),score=37.92 c15884_g1_i1:23-388(+)